MALSLGCGFFVAILWGGNIGAVYPLLTVLLNKKTLVEWVDERIEQDEVKIRTLAAEIDDLTRRIDAKNDRQADSTGLITERQRKQSKWAWRVYWRSWKEEAQPYVRKWTPNTPFRTLCALMGLALVGLFFKGVFDFLQQYFAGSVVQLAVFELRNRFYRQTMGLDLNYFSEKGTHDLMARFTSDVDSLASGMRALLAKVLFEPLKALSCLVIALWFNWRISLVALLLFPLAAVAMGLIGRYLKRISRRNLESMSRMYKILQESFVGIRVVKAFTMERYERRRFFLESKLYYKQAMKLIRTDALGGPIMEIFAVSAVAGALLAGSYLVVTGETQLLGIKLTDNALEPEMLLALPALILGMCDPLRKVFSVYGRVQRGVAASERIFQCMDRTPAVVQRRRAPALPRHREAIELRNVSFAYTTRNTVLKNIDLEIRAGETIAVVGTTGCGKTTLINLLPRFYDPLVGEILIDGQDIRDVSLATLREQMGIVTQHTILFDDTIFNNIAYGNPHVDPAEVERAAEAAYAHRFIEEFPDGYHTRIGEMGDSLSGGQRQRIALARAILRDPSILILDEATSSLDVESEALIHKALQSFARGRTTLLVTHRLSTLDIADRIVVIDKGQIEAIGAHHELLGTSTTYRRLHEVQARSA